jgi:hypothetical protein
LRKLTEEIDGEPERLHLFAASVARRQMLLDLKAFGRAGFAVDIDGQQLTQPCVFSIFQEADH